MIRLSAFADEIAAHLGEQITVLRQEGIRHIDLRARGVNVLDLTDAQVTEARRLLSEASTSPRSDRQSAKCRWTAISTQHLTRFERALILAQTFETAYIRLFSFYPPTDNPDAKPSTWRDEVLRRLRELTARPGAAGVTLVHENEKDIYGDTIDRCVDSPICSETIPVLSPHSTPRTFIQCGQESYPAGYVGAASLDRVRTCKGRPGRRHGDGGGRRSCRLAVNPDPTPRIRIRRVSLAGAASRGKRQTRRIQRPGSLSLCLSGAPAVVERDGVGVFLTFRGDDSVVWASSPNWRLISRSAKTACTSSLPPSAST